MKFPRSLGISTKSDFTLPWRYMDKITSILVKHDKHTHTHTQTHTHAPHTHHTHTHINNPFLNVMSQELTDLFFVFLYKFVAPHLSISLSYLQTHTHGGPVSLAALLTHKSPHTSSLSPISLTRSFSRHHTRSLSSFSLDQLNSPSSYNNNNNMAPPTPLNDKTSHARKQTLSSPLTLNRALLLLSRISTSLQQYAKQYLSQYTSMRSFQGAVFTQVCVCVFLSFCVCVCLCMCVCVSLSDCCIYLFFQNPSLDQKHSSHRRDTHTHAHTPILIMQTLFTNCLLLVRYIERLLILHRNLMEQQKDETKEAKTVSIHTHTHSLTHTHTHTHSHTHTSSHKQKQKQQQRQYNNTNNNNTNNKYQRDEYSESFERACKCVLPICSIALNDPILCSVCVTLLPLLLSHMTPQQYVPHLRRTRAIGMCVCACVCVCVSLSV